MVSAISSCPLPILRGRKSFYADVFGLENQGRNLVAEREPNAMMSSDCR
jgi:hypothetical protein